MKLTSSFIKHLSDEQRRKDFESQVLSSQLLIEILLQLTIDSINELQRILIDPSSTDTLVQQRIGELRVLYKQLEMFDKLLVRPSGVIDPYTTKTRKLITWLTKLP